MHIHTHTQICMCADPCTYVCWAPIKMVYGFCKDEFSLWCCRFYLCVDTHTHKQIMFPRSPFLYGFVRDLRAEFWNVYICHFFNSVVHIFVPCDIQISKYIAKQDLSRMYTYDRFFSIWCADNLFPNLKNRSENYSHF